MARVISLASIPVQRLALNAHYLAYPKYDTMSEPCVLEEKCGVLGGGIEVIKVHGNTNPRPATRKKWLFPLNLRKINDNVKLFFQLFKVFWNSSNAIYVRVSEFSSIISVFWVFGDWLLFQPVVWRCLDVDTNLLKYSIMNKHN